MLSLLNQPISPLVIPIGIVLFILTSIAASFTRHLRKVREAQERDERAAFRLIAQRSDRSI